MAKISEKTVQHVAKLARLKLSDVDVKKFSRQLSSVFEYMDVLEEVDVSGVKETSQVTGLENVRERDEVLKWKVCGKEIVREDLLGCTELPVESKQILVKPVIKK